MISQRQLLQFIDKHPQCNFEEFSELLFNNDHEAAASELIRNKEYLSGNGVYKEYDDCVLNIVDCITINSLGKQFLEQKFNEKWRFRIPLFTSIIALIMSILAFVSEIIKLE